MSNQSAKEFLNEMNGIDVPEYAKESAEQQKSALEQKRAAAEMRQIKKDLKRMGKPALVQLVIKYATDLNHQRALNYQLMKQLEQQE